MGLSIERRTGIGPAPGEISLDGQTAQDSTPIFQRIKDYLLGEIASGRWKEGDLVPSEQALVRQFGVSRMTVNRAVRELTAEQVLTGVRAPAPMSRHKNTRPRWSRSGISPTKYVRAATSTPAARACWKAARRARRWRRASAWRPVRRCSTR